MTTATLNRKPGLGASYAESAKDTLESLVVAFILAFVFRGFLVEAFVIPTGSMAPTLYGKHGLEVCRDCGFEYAYGMPGETERNRIKCPNCGWKTIDHLDVPFHNAVACPSFRRPLARDKERLTNVDFVPKSGDRILVFKWPFDLGGDLGPQPWDVVVFKNPADGENNYIKRLVGMPNEVLEIIGGDIYACRFEDLPRSTKEDFAKLQRLKYEIHRPDGPDRSSAAKKRREYDSLERKVVSQARRVLKIRRKTEISQKSLWHIVFDQDYMPNREDADRPRWQAQDVGSAWDTSTPRVQFKGLDSSPQSIRFGGKAIRDYYAYNFDEGREGASNRVGDLRLRTVLRYREGTGSVVLELSRREGVFELVISADGRVTMLRRQGKKEEARVVGKGRIGALSSDRPVEIEFGNVDLRAYVRIDGQPVLDDYLYDDDVTPHRRTSTRGGPPPGAEIKADHLDIELRHVRLERDIYYEHLTRSTGRGRSSNIGWGMTGHPIHLREGEYFVVGDNSPASQDSRLWPDVGPHLTGRGADYQLGTVPADQMIGKAFFVYWPSGFRIKWMPGGEHIGVVPNVGRMRWIR
jgi:signal peptidase I